MKVIRYVLLLFFFLGVIALSGLFTCLISYEYYQLAIIEDKEFIESYHFGSESMVGIGGDAYRSLENYTNRSLIFILASSIIFASALTGFILTIKSILNADKGTGHIISYVPEV